jgi:hypothetical protein
VLKENGWGLNKPYPREKNRNPTRFTHQRHLLLPLLKWQCTKYTDRQYNKIMILL